MDQSPRPRKPPNNALYDDIILYIITILYYTILDDTIYRTHGRLRALKLNKKHLGIGLTEPNAIAA